MFRFHVAARKFIGSYRANCHTNIVKYYCVINRFHIYREDFMTWAEIASETFLPYLFRNWKQFRSRNAFFAAKIPLVRIGAPSTLLVQSSLNSIPSLSLYTLTPLQSWMISCSVCLKRFHIATTTSFSLAHSHPQGCECFSTRQCLLIRTVKRCTNNNPPEKCQNERIRRTKSEWRQRRQSDVSDVTAQVELHICWISRAYGKCALWSVKTKFRAVLKRQKRKSDKVKIK